MDFKEMKTYDIIKSFEESHGEVLSRLNEIFNEGLFELLKSKDSDSEYFTTYIMNDAVESIIVYKNASVSGEFINDYQDGVATDISWDDEKCKYIMRIRQKNENVCILWFDDIVIKDRLYQYHNIGHYWVYGQEYLRQITYRIGLINDKYQAFSERYCNAQELELLPLMEFGPLQSYVYVEWDAKKKYESSLKGIESFEKLAKEVNDVELLKEVKKYKKRQSVHRQRKIADMLSRYDHQNVVHLLEEKIRLASEHFNMRSFGKKQDEELLMARSYIDNAIKDELTKNDIEVLEEQPFTCWNDVFIVKFYFIRRYRNRKHIEIRKWEVKLEDTGDVKKTYENFVRDVDNVIAVIKEKEV